MPMSPLQQVANMYAARGWTIVNISDEQFTTTRKAPLNAVFWIGVVVGLFIFVIPGLILLTVGLATRKEESVVVTREQAERELGIQ